MIGATTDVARRNRFRILAVLAAVFVSGPSLWVGYGVVSVVGDEALVAWFLGLAVAAIGAALVLSGRLQTWRGLGVALGVLFFGVVWYFVASPAAVDVGGVLADVATLLSGLSVFQILRADAWMFGITPAPLFASWYLVLDRRYGLGALVGGTHVSFFLLTGDLGTTLGLVAAVGVIGVVGFGRLEREGGTGQNRDALLSLLGAVFLVTAAVSLASAGTGSAVSSGGTVESTLLGSDDRLTIQGSISLSPDERFEVQSDERSYWRVGAFDRYTGDGWVRTGGTSAYDGERRAPPGDTETIRQTYELRTRLDAVPAAWKPVDVSANARSRETEMGGLRPGEPLADGERYTVRSARPDPSTDALRNGGGPYPDRVERRYLDLPASTPDQLTEFTDEITAESADPYESANTIEAWLEANKNYSLDIERPNGDIASSFLFEMDRGYCTYFATTMVAMLRSQGVPARLAVGYTPGEAVGENRYLVRGLDSHAWVEVYFSDVGWVRFDPTPADARQAAERQRLNGGESAATAETTAGLPTSLPATTTTAPATTPPQTTPPQTTPPATTPPQTTPPQTTPPQTTPPETPTEPPATTPPPAGPFSGVPDPSSLPRDALPTGLFLLGGVTLLARVRIGKRIERARWLRTAPDGGPAERVEESYERVEYLLSRRFRPRRPGETPREYVDAVCDGTTADAATTALDRYEDARYAGSVTEEDAVAAREAFETLYRTVSSISGY